ncbi:hypothetical protein [Roseobacter sp. GAI101]|uniref:hypothetical protein n=1 Tax=Roseobacter sp. (strain GAI101) TaxID=391589 RepID=UPI000187210C|nr:hypothetical protein [Roseobacter sp. GAI101]EEB83070.1 conserved hypothetical protein [Roseobacter sp. GAI101]
MTKLTLTKTRMIEGTWQGVITGASDAQPEISVTHANMSVPDFKLVRNETADHWVLTIPVPAAAIADGIQTVLVIDRQADQKIGEFVVIGDEVSSVDLRAEMDLLRAELDMLKRAFRRHCVETS